MTISRSGIPLDIQSRFAPPSLGDAGQNAPVPKTLQIYPWWLYKPPTGQDINLLAQNAFPLGGGTVQLTSLSLSLDQGTMGVIRGIDVYVNDMTPSTDVTFTLTFNGNPVPGYGNLKPFPRTAASVTQSFDVILYIPAGTTINVSVTDTDGAAYLVGYGYQGWTVPTNIDAILGVSGGSYTGVR